MKGGIRRKEFAIFVYGNFIVLPAVGWIFGGFYLAIAGFIIALVIDAFFPTWKSELTWKEIDRALNNIYKYGRNPSEMCIRVGDRRIYVYRDGKGKNKRPIRMAISTPLKDWVGLLNEEDYKELLRRYGTMWLHSNQRGPESYDIFVKNGPDDCRAILEFLFLKSVGGLRPDIYAQSVVNADKNVWVEHSEEKPHVPGI